MTRKTNRRDPFEQKIELALSPGEFIRDQGCCAFVRGLEQVASEIDALHDAARAAGLYETFLAGCAEKAEELDDSSANFNLFAKDLICRWVKAQQMSGADAGETATTLLAWMDDDPHAFCYEIERQLAEALDEAGLAAFESRIRVRLNAMLDTEEYDRGRWSDILRVVYVAQTDPAAYQNLTEQIGVKPKDCVALATMFVSHQPGLALEWVDRGIELERNPAFGWAAGHDLGRLRRELLVKLGRRDDAIEIAWAEYRERPSKFRFDDLMEVVPKNQHATWREKALDATRGADLRSVMELFTETGEIERLATLVSSAADLALGDISHYVTEPAAVKLEQSHPEHAARLWRAQALRLVGAGKSKHYGAAVANLDRARRCYLHAGLRAEWEATVWQIRADHRRKTGFMAAFERVARGEEYQEPASFLERAKERWGENRRGSRS